LRIGVDIGGTFTDAVYLDEETGLHFPSKVSSTPEDYAVGVLNSIRMLLEDMRNVTFVTHGTTVGVNSLLQGRLIPMGLITSRGFRDVLELGRSNRVNSYDPFYAMPRPLVPRYLRMEVDERIDCDGNVLTPLDEVQARGIVRALAGHNVKGIAVCLLNSYANPVHENMLRAIISEEFPQILLSISSGITREYREYERTSTTVINLGIMKDMSHYLTSLETSLRDLGYGHNLFIMQSNGGMMGSGLAKCAPVYTIQSTLAGGIIGIETLSRVLGEPNMIGADMGGTSFDVELVINGEAKTIPSFKIQTPTSGGDGYPVMTPTLDVHSIGAGGGSVAWVDEGGGLHVGPQSMGPSPGPACYGLGGDQPTVTDANVVLGRLNPHHLLGGGMRLVPEASHAVIGQLARRFFMGEPELASGILKIVCNNMAGAIRTMTLRRGLDPREFTLVAFGGAGPLHAAQLADNLGIERVLVVNAPGNFSAWGMLMAPVKHDFVQTCVTPLNEADLANLNSHFVHLEESGRRQLLDEGVKEDQISCTRVLDVRYSGQEHTIPIIIGGEAVTRAACSEIASRFDEEHQRIYLHSAPGEAKQVVSLRVTMIGKMHKPSLLEIEQGGPNPPQNAALPGRKTYFETTGFVDSPVYDRARLKAGSVIDGPAVIEEVTSTTLVPPNWRVRVDRFGHLIMTISGRDEP
jgi:N-methylhydantoinase A